MRCFKAQKKRGQTLIYLHLRSSTTYTTKQTSKAHAYGASIFALLLVVMKLSKFQVQDFQQKRFFLFMLNQDKLFFHRHFNFVFCPQS